MLINNQFQEMATKKYKEMKEKNISEDYLDKETLGDIMVFINIKPTYTLLLFEDEADKIYVGSNKL